MTVTTFDYFDAAEHNREICDLTLCLWCNVEGQDPAHILLCLEGSISRLLVCLLPKPKSNCAFQALFH